MKIIPAAVLASAAMVAAGAPLHAADLEAIKKRGVIKVIVTADEEPEMYNLETKGEPGFERELIEGFAKLHRITVQAVPTRKFEDILPGVVRQDGDLAVGLINREARRKIVDFTVEVLPARHVVVSHKPQPVISTLEQFRKAKVGAIKGTSWADSALEAGVPAASLQLFLDRAELLDALKAGKVTAMSMPISDLTLSLRRNPGLQAGVFLGEPGSAAWAVRKEDKTLKAALDEYLTDARKGQSWSRLVVKYFGRDALTVLGRAGQK